MLISKIKEKNVRVIVADDHKPMLDKIVELLTPHCEVVSTAADGKTALEIIERLTPDIAVLDISMPFLTGIEVATHLKQKESGVKVVIITAHDDEYYIRAALSAGALAYVVKTHLGIDLITAVESVYEGKGFIFSNLEITHD